MKRTALLMLAVTFAAAIPTRAQIREKDRFEPPYQAYTNTCDPAGNIDEVPFDASSLPVEDWLKQREARDIRIEMLVSEPRLSMDQQNRIGYRAMIPLKEAGQERKFVFFVGVDSAGGKRLTETSVNAVNVPETMRGDFNLAVLGCIYLRPGNYTLWVAAYDETTGKHGVRRQKVNVPQIKNDPLPLLESKLPPVRFPTITPEESGIEKALPETLYLPVANKRPLVIDIVTLNANQRDGLGPLAQMSLKDSSISVTTLDLETQKVVFESKPSAEAFDFTEMFKATNRFKNRDDETIDLSILVTRSTGAEYFRKFVEQRLKGPREKMRVMFVVSTVRNFPKGADISAVRLDANCNCRLFYIQMTPWGRDELETILKSQQSRKLEVNSALDYRKTLATIVKELEGL